MNLGFFSDHFEVAAQKQGSTYNPASTGTTTTSDSVESKSTHNSKWWLSYSMIASPVPQSVTLHCRHTACIRPRPRSYPAVAGHPWLEHRHLAGCHHDTHLVSTLYKVVARVECPRRTALRFTITMLLDYIDSSIHWNNSEVKNFQLQTPA